MKFSEWAAKRGFTDDEIARRVGCSRSTITFLRNGKRVPSLQLATAIERLSNGRVRASSFMENEQ
jgi:DNA-binding XRE family transcriptional regulator